MSHRDFLKCVSAGSKYALLLEAEFVSQINWDCPGAIRVWSHSNLKCNEEMSLKVALTLLFNFILKFSAVHYLFIKGQDEV